MKKNKKQKKLSKNGKIKKNSKILPLINKSMPYILAVLFVVTLFCNIWGRGVGLTLRGLFSTCGSYFFSILLLFHSLMWYYDLNRKICGRRVFCSVLTVLSVSTLQHLISYPKNTYLTELDLGGLYNNGTAGIGGGSIGGAIGNMFIAPAKAGLGYFIIIVILLITILQMFNITPASMLARVFGKRREEKAAKGERARKRALLRKKHSKFKVFDDGDDAYDDVPLVSPELPVDEDEATVPEAEPMLDDELDVLDIERETLSTPSEPEKPQRTYIEEGYVAPAREQIPPVYTPRPVKVQSAGEYKEPAPVFDYEEYYGIKKKPVQPTYNEDEQSKTVEFELESHNEPTTSYDLNDNNDLPSETTYETCSPFEPFAKSEPISDVNEEYIDTDIECDGEEDNLSSYFSENALKAMGVSEPKFDEPEIHEDEPVVEKKSLFGSLFGKSKAEEKKPESAPAPSEVPPPAPPKPPKPKKKYVSPPIDFFPSAKPSDEDEDAVNEELQNNARIIVETLSNFNAKTKITEISRGPTVTRYEIMPEAGVKVRSIANLADDIALYLAAEGIRMECPIPGKSAVGIEVPNKITSMVYLRSLLEDPQFKNHKSPLYCAIGKSISGEHVYLDIAKTPHLLVAGATGMGKSVCINAILISMLYKSSPEDMRLILIDPKRVEFSAFNGIPHLLVPVVCEAKKSIGTLQWAVSEMERRFELLQMANVRDIGDYNERIAKGALVAEKIPRIVIVIDELYDLKMQVPEIDDHITRLTQKARAAGIHVIIGTQRPSVDVITGVIKANIPSRISFRVPSQIDSRTILDEIGAEKLVARGDMLLKPVGSLKPLRVQGAFISDDEREMVTEYLKENFSADYDDEVVSQIDSNAAKLQKAERKDLDDTSDGGDDGDGLDDKFYAALDLATDFGKISSSHLQRKLSLGFQRAARIIDKMEELGYIGPANGSKPRDVLITKEDFLELRMKNDDE